MQHTHTYRPRGIDDKGHARGDAQATQLIIGARGSSSLALGQRGMPGDDRLGREMEGDQIGGEGLIRPVCQGRSC